MAKIQIKSEKLTPFGRITTQFDLYADFDLYELLHLRFMGDSILQYGYFRRGGDYYIVDSKSCGYKYDEATCTLEFDHPIKFQLIPEVAKVRVRYINLKHHCLIVDANVRMEGMPDNAYTRMIIMPVGSVDFNYLCSGRTDMRKGINSLCGVVHEKLSGFISIICPSLSS